MKVLVTGASGWVGSHVVRSAVARGWDVYGLVRDPAGSLRWGDAAGRVETVECDLGDWARISELVRDIGADACVHCAWYAKPGKYLTSPEHVTSLMNSLKLFEALATAGCQRFVGVGSCFEFDAGYGYLSEDTPLQSDSVYSAAKTAASTMLAAMAGQSDVTTTWARLFLQYGPGEDGRRLVPAVVSALLRGERVATTLGEQVRDFLHISDVAEALVAVVEAKFSGTVNIGSGRPVTVREVVETLAEHVGRGELVDFGALPYRDGDPRFICADNSSLLELTGWRPAFSLTSGLADTATWWRDTIGEHS